MTFDIRIIGDLEQLISVTDKSDKWSDTDFKGVPLGVVEWHGGGWG